MLFFFASFSQTDTVYFSGKVSDKSSALPVKNALIHLKLSNGDMYEALSNDSGYYVFKLKTVFEKGELSVVTDRNTTTVSRKTNGFIASKDKLLFSFPPDGHISCNFLLTPASACFLSSPPPFWFKENSTTLVTCKDPFNSDLAMQPEEIIEFYYELLNANPEIVVEVKGRCDQREKNRQELSEKRAQLLTNLLIAKGIPVARLVPNGVGVPSNHVTDADLVPKTEEQKKLAHQKNRSVSIRIINRDYVNPKVAR